MRPPVPFLRKLCVYTGVRLIWGQRLHIEVFSFSHLSGPNKEIRTSNTGFTHTNLKTITSIVPTFCVKELNIHLWRPNQQAEFSALESFQPNWS